VRPTFNQPQNEGGIWTRIKDMLNGLNARPILLASSSFAVLALALLITTQTSVTDKFSVSESDSRSGARDAIVSSKNENFAADATVQRLEKESEAVAPMAADPAPMVETLAQAPQTRVLAPQGAIQLDLAEAPIATPAPTDVFPDNAPSGLKISAQEPVSTFSVDVDTTSYALMRMAAPAG